MLPKRPVLGLGGGLAAFALAAVFLAGGCAGPDATSPGPPRVAFDQYYYETAAGRVTLPVAPEAFQRAGRGAEAQVRMPDGRIVTVGYSDGVGHGRLTLRADRADDITKWGVGFNAAADEYFTGVMERVVDGPQQASWARGITAAMNLRGQKVDMVLKPTTSVYAPFFVSSRAYGLQVETRWPGVFDFCATDPQRVTLTFEGPELQVRIFEGANPAEVVQQHALAAGPPLLPPRWTYTPWRWRDEHRQHETYYDGTPVRGPFNAEVMEDVLMMRAYGIPCGVYWIDRPWGPGPLGYDDFLIDEQRLPNFADNVRWLDHHGMKTVLWIGPFFQGRMMEEALARGYNLAGQERPRSGNNYPMVDMTNPEAKAYWQEGVARLLRLGVAGFKLDRGEENIPEDGPFRTFDGRTIRENRNTYAALYVKAAYDIARQYRGDDFVCMPRAAYTGSAPYGVFWGGDVGGVNEGLRASIIAVQRAAVMGYPNWGSDTGGYNQQSMEQELVTRWLAFSCFTPIMEVGPTRNRGFWNIVRGQGEPEYDATLIAAWRFYARLHQRLADYTYAQAREATRTGQPIVRPLFLADPQAPAAWTNWWTYLYGGDLLVSPVWQRGQTAQEVYLPAGARWRDAWRPGAEYDGGQTISVEAPAHQIPIFVRVGARVELGDLNQQWQESREIAEKRPDLAALEDEVRTWFEQNRSAP